MASCSRAGLGRRRGPALRRQPVELLECARVVDAIKAELKLTPEQEPAWSAFIARTQPQAGAMPRQSTREDWSKLTTPQRLDKMQALKAERDAAMAKRTEAIKSFYAALNADQQKVFDSKFMSGYQRAGMRGEHGQHRHHGGHQRMGGPL